MARQRMRPAAVLLMALLAGASLASVVRWALLEGHLQFGPVLTPLAQLAQPLLLSTLGVLAVILIFRSAEAALRRARGTPTEASLRGPLRSIEAIVALVVVLVAGASAAGHLSGAVLGLGLVGFGITLALQRPLLALAGWGSILAGPLFRAGDRIEVQGMVGDVLEVNLFTTRLWEIGSDASPLPSGGNVSPMRPTGRVVTVSNAVFLEQPVANASSDMPVVFDEFVATVAYEADHALARRLLLDAGREVLDLLAHQAAAKQYRHLTRGMRMEANFPEAPSVVASLEENWVELRLRYLVDVRQRAVIRTLLADAWLAASEAHPEALPNVYPRRQMMAVGPDGRAHR